MILEKQYLILILLNAIGARGFPEGGEKTMNIPDSSLSGRAGNVIGERQEDGGDPQERIMDFRMNSVHPKRDDDYICYASKRLTYPEEFIVQMESLATSDRAHHILLYGCETDWHEEKSWHCQSICKSGQPKILWAWAKNADPTRLPKNVGFPIGNKHGINQLVMQIHYKNKIAENAEGDESGIRLTLTRQRPVYHAGIYLFVSYTLGIGPHQMGVHADISCDYEGTSDMHPFAYRVHTHSLGRVVSAYHFNGSWSEIGRGNPQWPQAFYPIKESFVIKPGERMAARCTYDAPNSNRYIHVGGQHTDEMCNFYMMYYTDAEDNQILSLSCYDNLYPREFSSLPADNDKALPPNPALEEQASDPNAPHVHMHGMHLGGESEEEEGRSTESPPSEPEHSVIDVENTWPQFKPTDNIELGQVAGVAVDSKNIVHIFHRGPRKWDQLSFDVYNNFKQKDTAIPVNTLISIDENGNVVKQWGANLFYLPHGLYVDHQDNIWVTDVALHQVFKFAPGSTEPSLVLGKKFSPGSDNSSFCKPADVTVLKSGDFFVADGYCNHRIMKFSSDGTLIKMWGNATRQVDGKTHYPEPYAFDVPHSITALESKGWVCVADRENGRITCFDYNGNLTKEIHPTEFNKRVFAVSYSPVNDILYAVDGKEIVDTGKDAQGFIIEPDSGTLVNTFKVNGQSFTQPHDIAVSLDGKNVYVAEIGPNKIWKFNVHLDQLNVLLQHRSVKKPGVNLVKRPSSTGSDLDNEAEKKIEDVEGDAQDMGASLVIGCLLIIPVIIIIAATVFVRLRKSAQNRGYSKANTLLDSESDDDSEEDLYEHVLYENSVAHKQGNLHSLPITGVAKTVDSI